MPTMAPPRFKIDTINEIERKNQRAGQHFFDADTLRFFNSRISDDVIAHRFFITTEKGPSEERRATIRMIMDDGTVSDVGEFQRFPNPAAARKALAKARAAGVEIKNDPYEGTKDTENPRHFNWRAYLGDLPIGSRNTLWHARREGAQAKRPAYCD